MTLFPNCQKFGKANLALLAESLFRKMEAVLICDANHANLNFVGCVWDLIEAISIKKLLIAL